MKSRILPVALKGASGDSFSRCPRLSPEQMTESGFQTLKALKALVDHGDIESGVPEWRRALVRAVHARSMELFFLLLLDVACVCAEVNSQPSTINPQL